MVLTVQPDVLLICPSSHKPAISHYIHSQSSSASFSSLHVDLQTYDESQELTVGTCSVLRHFSARIQEDFVLLPCDLIPPESLPLSRILDKFRADSASDGSIATTFWFEGTMFSNSLILLLSLWNMISSPATSSAAFLPVPAIQVAAAHAAPATSSTWTVLLGFFPGDHLQNSPLDEARNKKSRRVHTWTSWAS